MTTDDAGFVSEDRFEGPAGECGRIQDLIPIHLLGVPVQKGLPEVEEHLARCSTCREAARFIALLQAARPEPPATLVSSTLERASGRGPSHRVSMLPWLLRAAAIAVVALGAGTLWRRETAPDPSWTVALESQPAMDWYGHDWMVAGEPLLDALPDDMLRMLVEEMER